MRIKILLCLTIMVCFSTTTCAQQDGADNYITNKDYRRVASAGLQEVTDLSQLQQIADLEIFYWYGCEACLKVEKELEAYLAMHPELSLKRTPLVAYPGWRAQAYLQPMMEQLAGKVELPSDQDLYRQCLQDCTVFSSFEAAKAWLIAKYKIQNFPVLNEAAIWQAEKNYRSRADSFAISQVPTILIKETYATDANSAQTVDRLIEIVDHLLNR